jgi:hypothetical protein
VEQFTLEAVRRTDWFGSLVNQVEQELQRLAADRQDDRPAPGQELKDLQDRIRGWSQSLAKPDLPPAVRAAIEADFEKALRRRQELEHRQAEIDALRQQTRAVIDAQQVVDRLNRLAEVLAQNNPTRGNLELSLHVEQIRCHQDGRVVVRTCKLGALAGGVELLTGRPTAEARSATPPVQGIAARPRRRARLRIDSAGEDPEALREAAITAADVHRFAGLGPEWFWEDTFYIPCKMCWSEEHAAEVVAKKRETGWPLARLAEHFGKSIPTIRLALKRAAPRGRPGGANGSPPAPG